MPRDLAETPIAAPRRPHLAPDFIKWFQEISIGDSRNVTARDAGDKQQPFNLKIPGGASSIVPGSHTNYDITHLQFLQADYLRGYNFGTTNIQPGRRVLATPMHDTTSFNLPSTVPNAPPGGTELMPDGSQATFIPAGRAVTWQLTGTNNNLSIVKERYWITFRPGEIRTCANCHGINDKDQMGRSGAPTNAPLALRQLLRYWKTNAITTYQVVVDQGAGSGNFGAGSILNFTANPPPSGKAFSQWIGAGVSSPSSSSTLFIMPGSNVVVTATYTNLPAPKISSVQLGNSNQLQVTVQGIAQQAYVVQSSIDLATWSNVVTNITDSNGMTFYSTVLDPALPKRFFRITFP